MNDNLTKREEEMANLLAEGKSNKGIATKLNVKATYVRTYLKNIYSKLSIDDCEQINKRVMLSIKMRQEK